MYDKAVVKNCGTLSLVPYNCEYQKMCNQADDNHVDAIKYARECFKNQEMCDKIVDIQSSTIQLFLHALKLKRCVIKQLIIIL